MLDASSRPGFPAGVGPIFTRVRGVRRALEDHVMRSGAASSFSGAPEAWESLRKGSIEPELYAPYLI